MIVFIILFIVFIQLLRIS